MTTVLTLALDAVSQARFESLRRQHYPVALNRIPAHVSLFHQLPGDDATRAAIALAGAVTEPFEMQVTSVRSLGRGVAYSLASDALQRLHDELGRKFEASLISQDRQPFRPHVVVQNKVSPEQARALLTELSTSFVPWWVRAVGIHWWEYLGGPWSLIETFPFRHSPGHGA